MCNLKNLNYYKMSIKVFIAGGTGWAGSELSKGVFKNSEMELVGALSRKNKGENLAKILNLGTKNIPIFEDIEEALSKVDFDVLVEYTKPNVAKKNIIASLKKRKTNCNRNFWIDSK